MAVGCLLHHLCKSLLNLNFENEGVILSLSFIHHATVLSPDDSAEFNLVNNALLSIFKMDAKGKASSISESCLES